MEDPDPKATKQEALLGPRTKSQSPKEEKEAKEKEKEEQLKSQFKQKYADPNPSPFSRSWLLSKMFFLWMNPIISIGRKVHFDQEMHYALRDQENIELELKKFDAAWDAIKSKRKLVKTFFRVYACSGLSYILIGLSYVAVQYFASYLIYYSIEKLNAAAQSGANLSYLDIAILTLLIILTRVLISALKNQLNFNLSLLGYRVSFNSIGG